MLFTTVSTALIGFFTKSYTKSHHLTKKSTKSSSLRPPNSADIYFFIFNVITQNEKKFFFSLVHFDNFISNSI